MLIKFLLQFYHYEVVGQLICYRLYDFAPFSPPLVSKASIALKLTKACTKFSVFSMCVRRLKLISFSRNSAKARSNRYGESLPRFNSSIWSLVSFAVFKVTKDHYRLQMVTYNIEKPGKELSEELVGPKIQGVHGFYAKRGEAVGAI